MSNTPLKAKLKQPRKLYLPKIEYNFQADKEIARNMKRVENVISKYTNPQNTPDQLEFLKVHGTDDTDSTREFKEISKEDFGKLKSDALNIKEQRKRMLQLKKLIDQGKLPKNYLV